MSRSLAIRLQNKIENCVIPHASYVIVHAALCCPHRASLVTASHNAACDGKNIVSSPNAEKHCERCGTYIINVIRKWRGTRRSTGGEGEHLMYELLSEMSLDSAMADGARTTDERTDWQTDGRKDGRVDRRTVGRTNGRTEGRTVGRASERTDERTERRTDGRTEGRAGGRVGGRSNGRTNRLADGRTDARTDGRAAGGRAGLLSTMCSGENCGSVSHTPAICHSWWIARRPFGISVE